ncbi:hypothetical protein GCM10007894_13470 [Paraferrimonas haliotis]|uniref:Uncharacterized protein n=1 Tax=Paraferrimonas haliotis TaxID=2013866 RepID=A0AA37TQ73_9GAMM|nr:hypothetical protein GCM10007894_13470 [Paraferrimonas haliotis]
MDLPIVIYLKSGCSLAGEPEPFMNDKNYAQQLFRSVRMLMDGKSYTFLGIWPHKHATKHVQTSCDCVLKEVSPRRWA